MIWTQIMINAQFSYFIAKTLASNNNNNMGLYNITNYLPK